MKTIIFIFLFILPIYLWGQQENQTPQKFDKKTTTQKVIVKKVKANDTKLYNHTSYPTEEYLKANQVPDHFPRYKDTGNPKLDGARYHEEKQAWIKKYPQEFEKIKHLNL